MSTASPAGSTPGRKTPTRRRRSIPACSAGTWRRAPRPVETCGTTCAGYVGGVPEQPVSREVVAVMARAGDGEAAHWRADFWIADADAAAARATQLGGSIRAGPEDAGPFREAVLADPAGATFSVSQLTGP